MSQDDKLELAVLKYVHDWPLDVDGPGGAAPIMFPDVLCFFEWLKSDDPETQARNIRRLDATFSDLSARRLIKGKTWKDGWGSQKITNSGRERILELENKTRQRSTLSKLKSVVFWPVGLIAGCISLIGFIVILTTLLAPSRYCPLLPTQISEWLASCASIMEVKS